MTKEAREESYHLPQTTRTLTRTLQYGDRYAWKKGLVLRQNILPPSIILTLPSSLAALPRVKGRAGKDNIWVISAGDQRKQPPGVKS